MESNAGTLRFQNERHRAGYLWGREVHVGGARLRCQCPQAHRNLLAPGCGPVGLSLRHHSCPNTPQPRSLGPHKPLQAHMNTHVPWLNAHPRGAPTIALRSTKEMVVQLKSSGGSQPFSPLQCRTAFPREAEQVCKA